MVLYFKQQNLLAFSLTLERTSAFWITSLYRSFILQIGLLQTKKDFFFEDGLINSYKFTGKIKNNISHSFLREDLSPEIAELVNIVPLIMPKFPYETHEFQILFCF